MKSSSVVLLRLLLRIIGETAFSVSENDNSSRNLAQSLVFVPAFEGVRIERIRRRWIEFFARATEGRASALATINTNPVLPVISSVAPKWGSTFGDTQIYIAGTNFGPRAEVQVGGVEASQVNVISASLIAARTPAGTEGATTVTVINTDGSADALSNVFAYRRLSTVTRCLRRTAHPVRSGQLVVPIESRHQQSQFKSSQRSDFTARQSRTARESTGVGCSSIQGLRSNE